MSSELIYSGYLLGYFRQVIDKFASKSLCCNPVTGGGTNTLCTRVGGPSLLTEDTGFHSSEPVPVVPLLHWLCCATCPMLISAFVKPFSISWFMHQAHPSTPFEECGESSESSTKSETPHKLRHPPYPQRTIFVRRTFTSPLNSPGLDRSSDILRRHRLF